MSLPQIEDIKTLTNDELSKEFNNEIYLNHICKRACKKKLSCGHKCLKACYQNCNQWSNSNKANCSELVEIKLNCGHNNKIVCHKIIINWLFKNFVILTL